MVTREDEQAIELIETQFNDAWNAHDSVAMVASFVDDVQFITVNGVWRKSRADYQQLIARLHQGPFRNSTRETYESIIRFPTQDVAVVHTRFRIHGEVDDQGRLLASREGVGTRVACRQGAVWRTICVQNTDVLNPGS